jgi:hypothetical protein
MIIDLFRVGTVGLMAIPSLPFAALCVLLFCTVLTGVPFSSARAALMPDVLPGDTFVLGSAIGNITYQASQILGFVAGAAVVAVLDPHKTLGIDAVTFGLSALILLTGVRSRPAPGRAGAARASLLSVSADGVRIVFGSRLLLTLLLFGWLAGFYIVPRGPGRALRALPARQRADRGTADGGRAPRHGDRRLRDQQDRHPVRADQDDGLARRPVLRPDTRARAFGVAQSGLYAVQGLGILAGGAMAQLVGAPLAVGLAGLVGLTAATILAMSWTHLRGRLIQARPNGPESPGPAARSAAC